MLAWCWELGDPSALRSPNADIAFSLQDAYSRHVHTGPCDMLYETPTEWRKGGQLALGHELARRHPGTCDGCGFAVLPQLDSLIRLAPGNDLVASKAVVVCLPGRPTPDAHLVPPIACAVLLLAGLP